MKYAFVVKAGPLTRVLFLILFLLLLANLAVNHLKWNLQYESAMGFIPLFDFDAEFNIPTIFSVLLFMASAFLLLAIARHSGTRPPESKRWRLLGWLFLFLGFDELSSFHERMGGILYRFDQDNPLLSESRFWMFLYLPLFLFLAFYFFRFFLQLPTRTRTGFIISAGLFVSGAVVLEVIGDRYVWSHGVPDFNYGLLASLEELAETSGLILFINTLLQHLQAISSNQPLHVQISS